MDFQQLRIFLNLAAQKSFSRTAESMFISQPSVSARMKGLEDELGVTLFDRSRSRELALTEAGCLFLDYAQGIVNLQEEAVGRLTDSGSLPLCGPVQLGASTVPGIYLLPPLLARFKRNYPGISFGMIILDSAQIMNKVLSYSVDLGFVGSLQRDGRLEYHPFNTDELLLIAPRGLIPGEPQSVDPGEQVEISLEACLPYNLLVREKGSATRELFEDALKQKGFSLRDFHDVTIMDSLEAIKQGVRYGLGISLVSRHTAEDYILAGLVEAYRLSGFDLARHLYLVRHSGRVLSRAAKLLLDFFSASTPAGNV